MRKFILKLDLFGKPIQLTFDKKGEQFKTFSGGILSILMVIILAVKIYQYSLRIAQRSYDSYTYFQVPIDPKDLGDIQMNQTGSLFIIEFKTEKILTYQEAEKNIQVFYLQYNDDGSKSITKGRKCVQEDFGTDKKSKDAFNKLQQDGYNFKYCPENQNFIINHKRGLYVHMARCSDSENITCYSKEIINANLASFSIQLIVLTKKMNFLEYEGEPVFKQTQKVFQYFQPEMATPISQYYIESTIRSNTIETLDDYLPLNNEYTYYSQFFDHSSSKSKIFQSDDGGLLIWGVILDYSQVQNYRICYNILNIISDSGGFIGSIQILFAFFVKPITEHSFFVQFIKRLYFIKTKDSKFKKNQNDNLKQQKQIKYKINDERKINLKQKQILNLNFSNSIKLFLISQFKGSNFCFCPSNFKKIQKLYIQGQQKIEKDTNLVKILKKIKYHNLILQHNFEKQKYKQEYLNNNKNEINLDSDDQNIENLQKNNDSIIQSSNQMFPENIQEIEIENKNQVSPKYQIYDKNIRQNRFIKKNINKQIDDQSFQKKSYQQQSFHEFIYN